MAQSDPVRIIPHRPEGIPDTGSFEVVWPGGREYFYWDDNRGRLAVSMSTKFTRAEALEQAVKLAREKRGALEHTCFICEDSGWVCENHMDRPWEGPHACGCGGAGAPCPNCNRPDDGDAPLMPPGFEADDR